MDYKVKKNNDGTAEITITISPQEWEKGFERAYEKHKSKVSIPGFRPGKAPMEKVKKVLGNSVIEDAIEFALSEALEGVIPKLEPRPVRVPRFSIQDKELDRTKGFTALATYEAYPDIQLPKLKKLKIETYQIVPSEEDIQKELEAIQKQMARHILKEESEPIEEGDLAEIEFKLYRQGDPPPASSKTGRVRVGNPENLENLNKCLPGLKTGETASFPFSSSTQDEDDVPFLCVLKVLSVYRISLPEIDDDFASEYDGSKDLQELKEKISQALVLRAEDSLRKYMLDQIYEKLMEEAKIVVADSLVRDEVQNALHDMLMNWKSSERTIENFAEKMGMTMEESERIFRQIALRRLKLWFLKKRILEDEKIDFTDEELMQKVEQMAAKKNESSEKLWKDLKKNGKLEELREIYINLKLEEFLLDTVEKKNLKTISIREAREILEKENIEE